MTHQCHKTLFSRHCLDVLYHVHVQYTDSVPCTNLLADCPVGWADPSIHHTVWNTKPLAECSGEYAAK
jgi:hypothetical protein